MSSHKAAIITVAVCAAVALHLRAPAGATEHAPEPAQWGALVNHASENFAGDQPERQARTRRGVAALMKGEAILGGGFLIAVDRLVTCRHGIQDALGTRTYGAKDLYIRLGFMSTSAPYETYPVLAIERISEHHDLAVLRLGPGKSGELPAKDRVLRLAKHRTPLHTPVYVWNHALGKPLTIADGGRVLFPHRATERELFRIEQRLRRELQYPSLAIQDMRDSYRPEADDRHRLISPIWANQPILGIDSRLDHGSSGAPVFDKHTHEVIGMLFAGPDRGPHPAPSSWHAHQAVLPAEFIRQALER